MGSLIICRLFICWQRQWGRCHYQKRIGDLFPRLLQPCTLPGHVAIVDPMARFCKTIIRDEPELDTSYGLNIWMSARWIRPRLLWQRCPRNPAHWRRHGTDDGRVNKVMHGEPRQEKELRKLADESTFSIPPLSCIWRGCQKRNCRRRVAPLGGDHRNVAQP